MAQPLIVSLPNNVVQFEYNGFKRDFEGNELNFGKIIFRKEIPAQGNALLKCYYFTNTGTPYWYTEEIEAESTLENRDLI